MKAYSIKLYQPQFKIVWDAFVSQSKNATFLFQRDFMEYHQHQFEDFSLMIFKNNVLVGLLPANRVGDELYSHQGLSYGGLLLKADVSFKTVLRSIESVLKYLYAQNIQSLFIKDLPAIYHHLPSEEVCYLYYILNAQLEKREVLSVIDTSHKLKFSRSRREGIKRAQKHHLKVVNDDDFEAFWNLILTPNLDTKHNVAPVHSLKEILYLKDRFPDNIKQFNVYHEGRIVAGATIFETPRVAHCQYISGNADKNRLGSLDVLHDYLINEVYAEKHYFDFGSSNENNGKNINYGLQFWKEGFGARTITQDFYTIKTKNYHKLNTVLS